MKTLLWIIGVVVLILIIWAFVRSASPSTNPDSSTAIGTNTGESLGSGAGNCTLNDCPFEIFESDSGKTFNYPITSRFTVWLDQTKNPAANLKCTPSSILGSVSNAPATTTPNIYAARFEGVSEGTCILTDDNFRATIRIWPEPNAS